MIPPLSEGISIESRCEFLCACIRCGLPKKSCKECEYDNCDYKKEQICFKKEDSQ